MLGRLLGNCLHDSEQVLGTMIDLAHEQLGPLLGTSPLGNIKVRGEGPQRLTSGFVYDRPDRLDAALDVIIAMNAVINFASGLAATEEVLKRGRDPQPIARIDMVEQQLRSPCSIQCLFAVRRVPHNCVKVFRCLQICFFQVHSYISQACGVGRMTKAMFTFRPRIALEALTRNS